MDTPTFPIGRARSAKPRVVPAILLGGLVAGTLDIGMAAWINWLDPRTILRFIAGGVLGRAALHGEGYVIVLGLLLQWGMSLVIAVIFVLAAARWRWMATRWIPAGLGYGVVVFVVMNYVVMPLSAWHRINHFNLARGFENLAAMWLFGLIIALAAKHFMGRRTGGP